MGTVGTHAINAALYPKMPYDPVKDFVPITLVAGVPNVLVLNPAIETNQALPFVEAALQRPYARDQLPLFISISSDADAATAKRKRRARRPSRRYSTCAPPRLDQLRRRLPLKAHRWAVIPRPAAAEASDDRPKPPPIAAPKDRLG